MTNKNKQKQIDSQRAKEDCHRPVEERNKISARITGQWPIKGRCQTRFLMTVIASVRVNAFSIPVNSVESYTCVNRFDD